MNNKIICKGLVATFLTFIMLAVPVFSGPGLPTPISGCITPAEIGTGATVTVTNIVTGYSVTSGVDIKAISKSGHCYVAEWANTNDIYKVGDRFEVKVYDKIETAIYRGHPLTINLDFSEMPVPVCPPDTTPYAECNSCCPPCPVCPDCPLPADPYQVWEIIAAALVGFGVSAIAFRNKIFTGVRTGVKMYRGRDGTLKVLHKHPGIKGYHSPSTLHRDDWERHPKNRIDAKYEKNPETNRWEYAGGD